MESPACFWRNFTYNLNNCHIHKTNEKTKFSKFVTNTLVASKCPNVNVATIKWENHFGNENVNWPNIFKVPFYITVDTKLREFQYKYLMHKIPNNQFLFKCKLKSHNICDFCNMCIDSNYHMFWECHIVQKLWTEIRNKFIEPSLGQLTNFKLSYEIISFCNYEENSLSQNKTINFLILVTKYFIFRCKCRDEIPETNHFNNYFKNRLKVEEAISNLKQQQNI